MKPFKAIAAVSLNRVIGAGNKIPWHLPEDFKWFKQMTTGRVIVMGRKTFESIGKPLPNRETIVLSRGPFAFPGVRVIHSLEELIQSHPALDPASVATFQMTRSADALSPREERAGREPERGADREAPPLPSPLLFPTSAGEGEATAGQSKGLTREIFICGGAQVYAQALPLCSDLYLTLVKREMAGDAFFPPFEDQFELVAEIREMAEFKILHYRRRG